MKGSLAVYPASTRLVHTDDAEAVSFSDFIDHVPLDSFDS